MSKYLLMANNDGEEYSHTLYVGSVSSEQTASEICEEFSNLYQEITAVYSQLQVLSRQLLYECCDICNKKVAEIFDKEKLEILKKGNSHKDYYIVRDEERKLIDVFYYPLGEQMTKTLKEKRLEGLSIIENTILRNIVIDCNIYDISYEIENVLD